MRGFKKNRLGANDHLVAFGGGRAEVVKLKDATWRVDCGAQFGVPALEAAVLKARLESAAAAAAGGDQKRALLQGAATVRMLRYAHRWPSVPLCGPLRSRPSAPLSLCQRRACV